MKKLTAILLITALTLALTGCASNEVDPNAPDFNRVCAEGRRDTPVRVATGGTLHTTLVKEYTFDVAVEDSDLIADVTIIEWLGESIGTGCATFFRARVNATLKGKEYEEITLLQSGNSEYTMQGFPLFKNGDRLLVFLTKAPGAQEAQSEHRNNYWTNRATLMDVVEYNSEFYLLNRGGQLHWCLNENDNIQKIGGELWSTVNEQFRKHDPFLVGLWDSIIENERSNDPAMVEFYEEKNRQNSVSPELYKPEYRDVFNYDVVVRIIFDMIKESVR
jgi:hypothetical protein